MSVLGVQCRQDDVGHESKRAGPVGEIFQLAAYRMGVVAGHSIPVEISDSNAGLALPTWHLVGCGWSIREES